MCQRVSPQWFREQKCRNSSAHQRADSSVHSGISGTAIIGDHWEPACNINKIAHEI